MNRCFAVILLTSGSLVCTSCVSKIHVRNQVTLMIDKVNALDDETAKNTTRIKAADLQAQESVKKQEQKAQEALQTAAQANEQSLHAQTRSDEASRRIAGAESIVSNLDNYKTVSDVSVQFASGEAAISKPASQKLDELANQLSRTPHYIVVIEGGTDSLGSKEDNYSLSSRRARVVMTYLAVKYNIPVYKMHPVGLGPDRPIASNNFAPGRAQNRRVDIRILATENWAESLHSDETGPTIAQEEDQDPQ